MFRERYKTIFLWLVLALTIFSGCAKDSSEHRQDLNKDVSTEKANEVGFNEIEARAEDVLCARRSKSQPICNADFSRLAAFYPFIDGLDISITGYLVVDGGILSLYASEYDYRNYIKSRSLEIRLGNEGDLDLFESILYRNVNVKGIYSKDFVSNNIGGRIGFMAPPFDAYEVVQRNEDQGVNDVAFSVDTSVKAD